VTFSQIYASPLPKAEARRANQARPQRQAVAPVGNAAYQYQYEVSDPEGNNFFGQGEKRDGAVTSGSYFVLLPDSRRQRVDYTVNGPEGFVSTVTYN